MYICSYFYINTLDTREAHTDKGILYFSVKLNPFLALFKLLQQEVGIIHTFMLRKCDKFRERKYFTYSTAHADRGCYTCDSAADDSTAKHCDREGPKVDKLPRTVAPVERKTCVVCFKYYDGV